MCRSILGEAGVELAKGIGIGRILVARAVPSRDILFSAGWRGMQALGEGQSTVSCLRHVHRNLPCWCREADDRVRTACKTSASYNGKQACTTDESRR